MTARVKWEQYAFELLLYPTFICSFIVRSDYSIAKNHIQSFSFKNIQINSLIEMLSIIMLSFVIRQTCLHFLFVSK